MLDNKDITNYMKSIINYSIDDNFIYFMNIHV